MRGEEAIGPGPVAVVGAGSWGTALAIHLGRRGTATRLWARDPALASRMRATRENARYLPGLVIGAGVLVTGDAEEALAGAGIVLLAVPSAYLPAVLERIGPIVGAGAVLVSAVKGIDSDRGRRMSEVIAAVQPGRPVAVLSGPSFAREVAEGRPTALVVAASDPGVARAVQGALSAPAFRLYTSEDVIGVELAGALKNVIAIAAGLSDSLDLGENARAALITRGLAEIMRLGTALGAVPRTFAGLAGIGDLVLTCTGSLSRNRALGLSVGRGLSLEEAQRATPMVAEGVRTVRSALMLARQVSVSMPIAEAVAAVLFEGQTVSHALTALLAREPRPEEDPGDPFRPVLAGPGESGTARERHA